jgi:AcrR family transcriptional regulator
MPSTTQPRRLSTAEDRRETVLHVAERVFAARGLHGTPTLEIARAAGISQAYLFRLFPTKAELFLALVERCNERIQRTFVDAAAAARSEGADVLPALGQAYVGLLADRDLLLIQLHAHAASDDPLVRAEMRRGFSALVELVEKESGAPAEEISSFFARGMLINVLAAMDIEAHAGEHWAQVLLTKPGDC